MISVDQDYQSILRGELEERCKRNPKYSLRAFAKAIGLSPSTLSEVLNRRYGISSKMGRAVARKLGYSTEEAQIFCDLIESVQGKTATVKQSAKLRLEKYKKKTNYHLLHLDVFKIIADWYHYAILELTYIKGFKSEPAWIARRLGLSSMLISTAIDRLKRLELLEDTGGALKATEDFTVTPSGIPSDALKTFHKQLLEKALSALYMQSVEQRDFSSMVVAIDRKKLPEAKEAIKSFRRNFCKELSDSKNKNDVYCLAIQFFNLCQGSEDLP